MRQMILRLMVLTLALVFISLPGLAEDTLFMTVGESQVLHYKDLTRVATSNPAAVEVVVTTGGDVLVNAKAVGLSTVHIWYGGRRASFRVEVAEDYSSLANEIPQIIGIPTVQVRVTAKTVVLEGIVANDLELARAETIAKSYREVVHNFLTVKDSYQVHIAALVTEVRVDDLKSLGVQWGSMNVTGGEVVGTSMIWEYLFEANKYDYIEQEHVWDQRRVAPIGARLTHLFENGRARLLAAPSILLQSGKSAQFLVGGEIPIPVVTKDGVEITWKEYGVRLETKASIGQDGMIDLIVIPEVSNLDWSNAITTNDMKVPAIATRRAQTQLKIQGGSTMALGGLLQREDSQNTNKIPLLGDLPVIGKLFRSDDFRKGQTELVIFITPTIVPVGQSPSIDRILPKDAQMPRSIDQQ